ncbi:protein AHNAK2 isoform X2 [Crotalus tigris]|nr:protein AHNAK2 isoform X2 [Crotalus tigris]XP_039208455.1 protein AHNAK2 isoform X2 [Crotalus tigris]
MSDSQESMEVTLQTEVESGASGFSVVGGGAEGLFVKQVLKESSASKLFSLREGDQLLSATIFFDNIKYEDALKILQYSEPYKVQFSLKRKLVGKDELETIHSATQSKKEKLSQGMDTMEISEKTISEEDKANLIVKQRVGRQKRTKKDRLSWPKFQSIKGKKILGHRRSRSTSDAYEHGIPDVSPTSTDTESQFQPEEIHGKMKKQSQKKLKFPTIGFKMHKSKQEPYEINPFKEYENDTTMELSEVMTREYTSLNVDRKSKEKEPKRGVSDTVFPIPQHTQKYPAIEVTITKPKEKKLKPNIEFTKQEPTVVKTQMKTAVIHTKDITDSQIKVSQNIPKIRKKKLKDSKVQLETQYPKEEKGKETNIASKYVLPQTEGPKVEVDIKMPKMDFSLPKADHKATKPELTADINISLSDVKSIAGQGILELKTPDRERNILSEEIPAESSAITLEDKETKFNMLKLQMPKFGVSLPKGKGVPEEEQSISSIEADLPKTFAEIEANINLTEVDIQGPSLDMEIRDKGKIKMPALKMPSVKVAKLKPPEVGIAVPKIEADVTLPKQKVEGSDAAAVVQLPEPKGTIDERGLKIHMPSVKVHVEKPEVKGGDITKSAPEVKIPMGSASLELKAPDIPVAPASGKVSVQGPDVKLESGDIKFQMPKFHMPKFGISLPKGTGIPEAEIGIPSVEADLPKTELKTEITLPSAQLEADLKLPEVEVGAPSLDVEIGDKGKIKMPEAKIPSVKVCKVKGPEVGISLPKVEADVALPNVKAEVSDGAEIKLPEAEGTIDRGGLKIHMPKFKMPSMGFSKPDIKGPKVDVDVSMPKVDLSLPEAELHLKKPEVKGRDITISAPEVKIPTDSVSLELKATDIAIEPPSGKVSVQGPDVKLKSGDRKFQMPKFHMPKFGISLPKGKGVPEGEIGIPSMEADLPKTELKTEITLPSAQLEAELKLPEVEVDAPSLDMEIGDKGKIKMPEAKIPSIKVRKLKEPEVGISLPKVEADVTVPKVKAEVSDGAEAIKLPEAEGTMDRGGLKIHMPKFKMPSMGFSKPDIKGPKIDVDVSMPKVDLSLPEAELHIQKPEVKGGDITISTAEVKIPTDSVSLELKAPDIALEPASGKVSMQGPDVKLESGDMKFQMPKFHMPKFGISLPKGTDIPEAEIGIPSVEADLPKTEFKTEITLPSAQLEADLKLPEVEVGAPSLDVEIGDKGKIKMPEAKISKVPKVKGPEVGISLPKVEADVTVPKVKVEVCDGAEAVKLPEAEGTIDRGGLKIHMPKFKMPSMGFSKPDIKDHKVDVDVSMPKVDISLPEAEIRIEKPEVKGGDITISAPEVKIPTDSDSLELKTPDIAIEPPSGMVSVQGSDVKLESGDRKFQMPKFHMPKFGISLPKGKGVPEAETEVPSMEAELPKTKMKREITLPSAQLEAELKLPEVEVDAPSLDMEIGDKGKIKMPEAKIPSIKVPKVKGPEVGISLPKVEADVTVPKVKAEVCDGAEAVKLPETEGTMDRGGLKIHMPKFKMPSMGFSKPDIKGPKVHVDVSMPKVDLSLPEAELHVKKPEVKGRDITISAPEVKIPTVSASLELKAPDIAVEPASGKVSMQGPDVKLESGDMKFQMPKFHMPKFGISLPKGTGIPEAEIGIPSVEADLPKTEFKTEITLPSAQLEADLKLPEVEVGAPSLDMEIGDKGKIKMPEAKIPKVPKVKGPEVGISLLKVEADVTVPKVKAEVCDGAEAVKLPEAEGTIDRGGLKIHMPKFKMPSMGFSKPDIKDHKVDVDVSMPKVDISLPEAEIQIEKPEVKGGDITISAPEVKIPTDSDSLELKAPDVAIEPPSGKVSVQGSDVKLESGDRKFQMPKFHMPKFGISLPKGTDIPEAEIGIPSVEADLPKTEFKTEITLPSAQLEADLKLPEVEVGAPSLDVEIGDKGKIKMPEAKIPKVPKVKGPEVGISLLKVEADVTVPKVKAEVCDGAEAVKLPEAEGTIDSGGLKIHMPKFKMPSMGFSKPDIKDHKVDVDVSMPKVDISLPEAEIRIEKPEVKGGDITISAPEVKIPTDSDSLELKAPDVAIEPPSGKVSVQGSDVKLESGDRKFQMPRFHMPKFGISLPKGTGVPEAETDVPSMEADLPKTEMKMEITLPSAQLEAELKLPEVEVDAPSLDMEIGDKGKIKMSEAKMPSVRVPKVKGPEVGISLPKVEADVTIPKVKAEVSDGAEAVKLPEAEGTIEGAGVKIHMPKFKMPSMGFSKPDIKGSKVDVDVSMPKVDLSLPEAELHVKKPEVKGRDITISAPEVKIPTGSASLELKAPDVAVEPTSGKVSVQGPDVKLESGDVKFQMLKFHMPKFGISLPKGTGIPEAEIGIPSMEADLPKTELKTEITLPSAQLEADLKLPEMEIDAPSLDVQIGHKGKMKIPKAKMPSVKVPKVKGPEVGISLPKVEADVTVPKVKAEVSDGAGAIKLPEAEGTIDGGGLKIHMPKLKMPSMGFSKPDIKGHKVDVDVSMPKVDISLPEAEIRIEKPEVKGGDTTISAPEVKIPTDSDSLELKTPDVAIEPPSGKVSVQGSDVKLESGDRKFQMPKFHMPKFGISLPKGKGVPEAEIGIPSVETDLPKTELKTEITLPSAQLEAELKLPEVEVDAPSLDMEIGDKGKIKMSEAKIPSVKVPKVKGPEVGISLPKVEADVTVPKVKAEVCDGAEAVKLPEAEGTIDSGGLKIHMPKFKMPSMGFSKPDIKDHKVHVDVCMPKVDISLPEAEIRIEKPEVKGGDITISAPEVKIPTDSDSLELKAPDVAIEPPSGKVSVQSSDVKLESGDRKFQMPKFHMPKFGISLPKGKGVPEAETDVPSMEADLPKTEMKMEITLPSAQLEAELKLPEVEVDAPSLDMEIGDKGKIKMSEAKMPSVRVPKVKGPEVGISLPKVEADVTIPKVKAEVSDGAEAVKLPEAEGTIEGAGVKIHMPKFKMPSMGFSKPDIKGSKVDVDVSMPKVDLSLPEAELHVKKPEVKGRYIIISAPEVKIPTDSDSLELKTPDVAIEPPSGKVSVQGSDVKLESGDRKFQMPKFHMPKFGILLPKGKGVPEAEISIPSVETDLPKTELKTEITLPSAQLEAELKLPEVEVDAPSLDMEIGDKGKIKMSEAKIPSVKVPKVKGPEVGISLPKVEADVTIPKVKAEVSDGAEAVKLPEAEGTIEGGEVKIHMPKFKMPGMGFSKPDIKDSKVDVDVSMPKVDLSLPEAELHVKKSEVKGQDITISAPEVKIPTGSASLELKAPDIAVEPTSGKVSVHGPDVKLESGDMKFQMPKFHMPKFEISLPKGTGIPEAEIGIPSVETDLPKTELKTEITLPSAQLEADIKLPEVEVDAPSLDVEIGEKGKIKIPKAKMPRVKVPRVKGPEVGISLPKVEADVTVPKVKAEVSDGAEAVKLREAEGTMDRGGLKIHMPKFKMPSRVLSKPDIKGPKVDVDVSMPKVDISLPEVEIRVEKPEVKGREITISASEVKIPTDSGSLDLKAPDIAIEPPSGKFSVQDPDVKLKSGDRKFQMPKFHMPKFGTSLPKGKGVPEAEISIPSVEADLPKTEVETEITLPSAQLEADLKLPKAEVDAPSLDVEIGDKGKIKIPKTKMPSVKVPKVKGPEVGISLPKVEADVALPKVKAEMSDGAEVKLLEAEGTIDGGGLKIHMPKFKMPSRGLSKPDIKGPKVDVDVSMPKVDISLPEAEIRVEKPEVKGRDITISGPEVKIPTDSGGLDLKAPNIAIEPPSGKVSVQDPNVKLESGDRKFQMPKFHMPKFGISLPKGKGVPEAETDIPSVEAHLPKKELKMEITLPSAQFEADLKLPEMEVDAPSLDVEIGDKGKIKMPEAKIPSVKVPKVKGPEVEISLPKVEADVVLPIVKAEMSDGAEAIKLPEAEGTMDRGGLKIHMSKFKMPSMGFSKPDIKGHKVDVDVNMPKVDLSLPEAELHVEKPEVKGGDITISSPEVKIPTGSASLELKAPDIAIEPPSGKVSVQDPNVKLESGDRKFQMPKFHIPKFGISLPKGTGVQEAEIAVASVETDLPKTELKTEITLPSVQLEADLKLPEVEVDTPSLDVEIGDKGKNKIPKAKMPSVKVPKVKGPEVGISLPKVEADVTIPKVKVEVSDGTEAIKLPEAEGTMDRGGLKIHMPKFKMPSIGFSKPDIKGPSVYVDGSMPKVDLSLLEAELHVEKPEVKGGDITISSPEVKIPTGSSSLELKAPDVAVESPSGKVSVQGPDVKLESGDRKFQMPRFHMPKFGISLPKGTGVPEAEIGIPSVETKTQLKTEITLPSAQLEADLKLPEVEVDTPNLDVEIGDKGKIKIPKAKMPSVKVPKVKGPEVGISPPKVEADVAVPKVKAEVFDGAEAVKLPEAEGTIEGGGLKIHMPKFKMPSIGFSKPDIKGPNVDVEIIMPKVDLSLPEAELHVEKREVKGVDITISAPEVKIPTVSASLELKAPDIAVEPPSGKVSDVKMESRDRKFQMPKFHMPKFGISMPKGKGVPEGEISIPSVEAELPKTELKTETTLPSVEFEADLKLPKVEVDTPSLEVDIVEGKMKLPDVKMPSVKVPKVKGPEVGISLPKVEADVTVPKVKVEVCDGAEAVKLPEAEDTIDRGALKIHMPKFKMPSRGLSKPDIKGPKVDVDVSMTKVDVTLPEPELQFQKPEVKEGDITISEPEIKFETGSASLELKAADIAIEPPSGKVSVQGPDVKLESGDSKFKVPKFQMPKFGISKSKAKDVPEGEVIIPSMEGDLRKTNLQMEITLPSSELEADMEAPILHVDVEEKGKIKMPEVKLPSVKPPKLTAPEVDISLPKVEVDISLSKANAELPDSEATSKVVEAEGGREKGRMKIHMPKFKMPSMGFSKSDIKGPKIDADASMPDVHTSLPKVELSITKPQLKTAELEGDIGIAAREVKIPWVPVTVELQAPNIEVQASSGKVPDIAIGLSKDLDVPRVKTTTDIIDVAVEAPTIEMESDILGEKKNVLEQKIKMPQIIRADVKTAAVGISTTDISVTQSEVGVQDLHGAGKEPETKGEIIKEGSLDGEEKAHFKMPKFKLPSLSWSPKKEASLKTNIKEPLEEPKLDIVSDDTGTEPKVTLSEDQGVHTDGNVDIATKKGQIKRPHLIMPKISLSKTKLPKADVDIVVEGDGALVQIPDIESSFTTRKVEETEISVKMLKGEIKEETKTFQTDTDINLFKTDIKVPMAKGSFEQKCLETEFKGDICMDSASMKSDGTEGEFRMPKLKMPKFGISDLSESDLSVSGITSPKPKSDVSQFQITEYDKLGGKAQSLQVKSDEGISEEIQTEESQSWFKMPKFKMPSFGRTSKTRKSDAETEDITGEAHVTELQVEVKSPKVVTISREPDSEKNISKEKVMLPQEDVIVQKKKQSTTDQLVGEGSFLHSSEKIGRKPSDLESKMYANVVKDGAEGQSSQTEFIGTVPKMDIDRNIPRSEMPIQQPEIMDTMAVTEIPSTEITMGRKIDAIITDTEPLQSLDTQPEEMGTEKKSPKKDSQGKESIFKMPTFSVPLFGWSTTKSNAIVPGIESDLEEPVVTLSKVKMDVSITDEDFEIIDFPVEGFEKDLPKEGEVKAEEKEKTSKTKASKFKIPKFANLRSKSQGAGIQVDSPKEQIEVSLVKSEEEIQVQDKKTGDAEVSFQMPKFKMPKFTHRISEGEKLISEETMEIKDTTDDDISQLQFKTMFPEDKGDDKGDDIQKSKVRITTLSEPAIQRPQVGSKFPSTDSSFADTTVYLYKQVPKEFSAEFFTEKIDTIDGNIQKSVTKITTPKEPDIQRAPLEIKLQPEDPFSSSASVQVKGSITDSKEIKIESKSTFGSGDDAETQETFSTQIVKESEIPPSEVKTAAFGFSLRKVKIQESHVSLDVPIKLSSTKCMGEIFEDKDHQLSGTGEAAQKAGLSEVKPSDKDKDVTYEFTEGTSAAATLTKLKSFTVDIQSSSEFAESHSESIEISKSATETAEETIFTSSTDEVTDEKEKLDSKRSGKFKLWFPSIGFSSTTDDSTSDSKPEALQKVQPDDSSKLDSDTAKEADKTGWFKFPKLGLSSPTKKSKEMDKEKETDSEEEKDEESLTEKNETFFDAQETLSLTEKEENETSGDTSSEPIVSSSARTELILLEKGKAKPKYAPEDSSK